MNRVDRHGLQVDETLANFLENQALPGTDVDPDQFWQGFSDLIHNMGPKNRDLLAKREDIQSQIDNWHKERRGQTHDAVAYKQFLLDIGYIIPEGAGFQVETTNIDPEIATLPGPQLVVPIMNARYALNAGNARWGSLYDALYGTDAMGDGPQPGGYDPARGDRVIAWAKAFLDKNMPLISGSHADVTSYTVENRQLSASGTSLANASQFVGYNGSTDQPSAILLPTPTGLV